MNRAIITTLTIVVAMAASACAGDDSGGGVADEELRPAGSVRAEEAFTHDTRALGDEAKVGDMRVTVSGPSVVNSDSSGPWLEVNIRYENPTDEAIYPPDLNLLCTGSDNRGGTVMGGTLGWGKDVPAKSFDEGTVHLLIPGDGRFGEPVPECPAPAVITANAVGVFVGDPPEPVLWVIDDSVVAELNGARPTS